MTPNNEQKTNIWDLLIVFVRSKLAIVIAILTAIGLGLKLDFLEKFIEIIKGL